MSAFQLKHGSATFPITATQFRIVQRALASKGTTRLKTNEERSVKRLVALKLGTMREDDGSIIVANESDGGSTARILRGEWWLFTVTDGVTVVANAEVES